MTDRADRRSRLMHDNAQFEIPQRPADGHKGTFGRVMIVGGSTGMAGSVALSGMAALRSGSGLVSLAVPMDVLPVVASFDPAYMTIGLPDDAAGQMANAALPILEAKLSQMDAAGIGPGLGLSSEVVGVVSSLYEQAAVPLVVDADALNALAQQQQLDHHAGPRILTPHPGEFARLTRTSIQENEARREEAARQFANATGVTLILKGHRTVVTNGSELFVNETGNSGMATGGSGDVLTGIVTSLLGQGMRPFAAAQLGVFIHGRAGDIAARELSERALTAGDLPAFLGLAWRSLEQPSAVDPGPERPASNPAE